jgi:hypothetical protein
MPIGIPFLALRSFPSASPSRAPKKPFLFLVYNIPKQLYITMEIDAKLFFVFPEALAARTGAGFARTGSWRDIRRQF